MYSWFFPPVCPPQFRHDLCNCYSWKSEVNMRYLLFAVCSRCSRCSWKGNCRILPDQTDNIQYLWLLNCFEISHFISWLPSAHKWTVRMAWMATPLIFFPCGVWVLCSYRNTIHLQSTKRKNSLITTTTERNCHYRKFFKSREWSNKEQYTFHRVDDFFYRSTRNHNKK